MKLMKTILVLFMFALALNSCVSKKLMKAEQVKYTTLQTEYATLQSRLKACDDQQTLSANQLQAKDAELDALQKQISFLKENNTVALKQLENLSVISSSQAESIKKSLENIGAKDAYIQGLQSALNKKDSLNLALVTNLKGAIGNLDDKDINIKVDKGVVYVDISDKLLFKSGSYDISDRAKEVLGKVAMVLKNQPDIEFMVEGHTDNVAFARGLLIDNWDLSVKRATSVVRILQNKYGLDPAKMAAAGRSQYLPVADNGTPEGKASNRRTRIVILPQLDQFFKLLEPKKG
jgi:chemotaxis protein MotB